MGNSLELKCDSCERVVSHSVELTHPRQQRMSLVDDILGEQHQFRVRIRKCDLCRSERETVEIDLETLRSLTEYGSEYSQHAEYRVSAIRASTSSYRDYIIARSLMAARIICKVFGLTFEASMAAKIAHSDVELSLLSQMVIDTEIVLDTLAPRERHYLWMSRNESALSNEAHLLPLSMAEISRAYRLLKHPSRSRVLRRWVDFLEPSQEPDS